ncbi:hypothetical protein Ga0609869_000663 [Rhodovulum iodosum]|uniref:Excalibur calcium-binding domain-containing protein n=1 Tax=Rhodovulum iodosum TaxID=68291 RepID=A0ABV3XPQ2_9RHOB|nr:hypothetical protein [Rhodovulum robiginosum]RSK31406.1 hypothetical protein EJA01_14775 [Rhodovulum robiginosum]
MRQLVVPLAALVALAGCEPEVPDSAAGVGFADYASYQTARESRLQGQASVLPPVTTAAISEEMPNPRFSAAPAPAATVSPQATALAPVNAPVGAPLSALSADRVAAAPVAASPLPAAPAPAMPAGQNNGPAPILQDETYQPPTGAPVVREPAPGTAAGQTAVAIEPAPVPQRSGTSAPNIVAYAINTTNRVGQPRYRRSNPLRFSSFERNCGRYPSDDLAQEAFLGAGGPERDRLNLDPDGDGFACRWDPAPFRQAVN